jgi:TRAP-type C4-dicarboxylate transport system permease small subunit
MSSAEHADVDAEPEYGPVGRALAMVCKTAAIIGTLIFIVLVVMSIASISGRKIASMPVPGDVEMLQLCSAFAASTFFAWCHLNRGDVKVDFFTDWLPEAPVHALDSLGSLLVGLFGALIAWRTGVGALALKATGETTMILGAPLWIGQALMVPGFVLLGLAGLYRAAWHLRRMRGGHAIAAPLPPGAAASDARSQA